MNLATRDTVTSKPYIFTDIDYYTKDLHLVMAFFALHGVRIRFQNTHKTLTQNATIVRCEEELFKAMQTARGSQITLDFPIFEPNYKYLCSVFHITKSNVPVVTKFIKPDLFDEVYTELGLELGTNTIVRGDVVDILSRERPDIYLALGLTLRDIDYCDTTEFTRIQNDTLIPGTRTTVVSLDGTKPNGTVYGSGIVINAIVSNGQYVPITMIDLT